MQIAQWLKDNTAALITAGIETARLDCIVLLEDVLEADRSYLLAHPEAELTAPQQSILNNNITQRLQHVPLAYIRGHVAFYGRTFYVNKHVLTPRPESETLIDELKKIVFQMDARPRIADLGTGSGCLGITASLEIPYSEVHVFDIDPQAIIVAKKNADRHGAALTYHTGDMLMVGPSTRYDVIIANLPYVPDGYPINRAASYEPRLALFSGKDGLGHYRRLWEYIATLDASSKPRHVIAESLVQQHAALMRLAHDAAYLPVHSEGLMQHFMPEA